jgi:hypothetical protein
MTQTEKDELKKSLLKLVDRIFYLNQQLAFYKMPNEFSSILEKEKENLEKLSINLYKKLQKEGELFTFLP